MLYNFRNILFFIRYTKLRSEVLKSIRQTSHNKNPPYRILNFPSWHLKLNQITIKNLT